MRRFHRGQRPASKERAFRRQQPGQHRLMGERVPEPEAVPVGRDQLESHTPPQGGHHIGIRHPGIRIGHRHPDWCRINGRCHVHVRWHRPWIVGTGVVATTYAVTPAIATAKPCTCLTKEYTPDNLVVFKDQCTKEVASAPAGNTQALLPMPQQDAPAATQQ